MLTFFFFVTLQLFAIFAFATCGGYSGQLRVSVDCMEKASSNLSIGIDFAYPFRWGGWIDFWSDTQEFKKQWCTRKDKPHLSVHLVKLTPQTIFWIKGRIWSLYLLFVCQVVPGIIWGPCMWGHEEGACFPHWRLLILCRVLCHYCGLCLSVLPHGHRRLHILSKQIPRNQSRATHCEHTGLILYTISQRNVVLCCGFMTWVIFLPVVACLFQDFIVTVVFSFMWLVSSSAWAKALSDVKLATDPDEVQLLIPACKLQTNKCGSLHGPRWSGLNTSVVGSHDVLGKVKTLRLNLK